MTPRNDICNECTIREVCIVLASINFFPILIKKQEWPFLEGEQESRLTLRIYAWRIWSKVQILHKFCNEFNCNLKS